jgi:hypothetical protein
MGAGEPLIDRQFASKSQRTVRASQKNAGMDEPLLEAVPDSPGWASLRSRRNVPGSVALLRKQPVQEPLRVGPEEAARVRAWINEMKWESGEAPVRLIA